MNKLKFEASTGPVDEDSILSFESLIGSRLPDAYRQFIKLTNGGILSTENQRFSVRGHPYFNQEWGDLEVLVFIELRSAEPRSVTLSKAWKYQKHAIPPGTIPIASDACGNRFLLGIAEPIRGNIFFWEHDFGGDESSDSGDPFQYVPKIADSFEEFINALK